MAESSEPPKEFISTELTLAGPSSQPSPSTEPTLSMAGTSSEPPKNQNPEPPSQDDPATFSFSFKIRPASKLKIAMEALSDEGYNEHGMGMLQVNEDGFAITTTNYKTIVMGYLRLKASGLIKFKCNHPFEEKEISLKKINETLGIIMNHPSVADKEIIGIHHVQGSNELCFTHGSLPTKFSVELLKITDKNNYFDFPEVTHPCAVMVQSDHMKLILQHLDTCEAKHVSFHITDRTVCITVGRKYQWNAFYDENCGISGMIPGQMHRASFEWPHSESLKKALPLATGVLFSPLTDPPKSVLLRFNLKELGDLVYNAAGVIELYLEPRKKAQILAKISRLTPIPLT